MPPKPKFTREDIIDAAVNIIRESSVENITAQSIAKQLNTSTRPMFNYFSTVEELRNAATEKAWQLYNDYAEKGLAMTPSFKGFAMEYIRFAMDEPSLFRLLFMRRSKINSMSEFLDREGHLESIISAVTDIFKISRDEAKRLYENLWIYAHGIAALCASEIMKFTDEEIAEKLGIMCRGLIISLREPNDERTKIMPKVDREMPGSVIDYITSQNNE